MQVKSVTCWLFDQTDQHCISNQSHTLPWNCGSQSTRNTPECQLWQSKYQKHSRMSTVAVKVPERLQNVNCGSQSTKNATECQLWQSKYQKCHRMSTVAVKVPKIPQNVVCCSQGTKDSTECQLLQSR